MPDPGRLVRASVAVAVRAGMTRQEAASAVLAVAAATLAAARPLYTADQARAAGLVDWVQQIYAAAHGEAARSRVL